jgi:hypothetical protein
VAVQRQPHVKEHRGGNAHVLVTGDDVQDEAQHRNAEHQAAHDQEHAEVAFEQSIVDQEFGNVGLQESEAGGGDAGQKNKDQAGPVRHDETQRAAAARIDDYVSSLTEDVVAMQNRPKPPRPHVPMGCSIMFTPGWEVDSAGGTAGLCQPVERDIYDCFVSCYWPAQVPDHLIMRRTGPPSAPPQRRTGAISTWFFHKGVMQRLSLLAAIGAAFTSLACAGQLYLPAYPAAVLVFDEAKGQIVDRIPLSTGTTMSIRLSPDHRKIYCTTIDHNGIEVIDVATRKVINHFVLNTTPRITASSAAPRIRKAS